MHGKRGAERQRAGSVASGRKETLMRTHIVAHILATSAPAALAQQVIAPPIEAAPAAMAPLEARVDWCDRYATWLVAMTPGESAAAPADVREGRRLEVELNACRIDPRRYERDTRAEADRAAESAQG